MKRFVLWAVVPALIALLVPANALADSTHHMTRSIRVFLRGKTGGSGSNYLHAINGYHTNGGLGSSWENQHDNIDVTYRVISTTAGHFKIAAHYTIINVDTNPVAVHTVDRMLPVWEKEPAQSDVVIVENSVETFACLSDHQSDN